MLSPFLLSALEELTQGLGRGKPFSKYAMQDLENCCSVGFLLSGEQMDLLPGSTFQMIQREVGPPANFFSFPSRVTFHGDLVGTCRGTSTSLSLEQLFQCCQLINELF